MGIDFAVFERLVDLSTRFQPTGRTVMLGRQAFAIKARHRKLYDEVLRGYGRPEQRFDFLQDDGYSENLLKLLGFGDVETMDFSDYQGATLLHDLNRLPAQELENQFDLIIDGGTTEHVFNIPVALEGLYRMLSPGGRLISVNGLNGWYSHGMYQFTPELVWTFWHRACNCRVHDCRGVPQRPDQGYDHVVFEDPGQTGRRLRLRDKIGPGRTYLVYEIEKTPDSHLPDYALQSDYEAKWQGAANAGQTRLSPDARDPAHRTG
ncbi:MAG: class I SAM-dependent methyltransferase [Pseudomonadota bacterium]